MSADYIPNSDAAFDNWQAPFALYAGDNHAALGLTTAQIDQLNTLTGNWTTGYANHLAAQTAASAAKVTKDADRAALEAYIRTLVAQIQANPAVTDTQRAALGITVKSGTHTPVGPPTTQPVLVIDTSVRWQHTLSFADSGTPSLKAKPAGVMGCEIWRQVGGSVPAGPEDLTFLAIDTDTPYLSVYPSADVGKTVYYVARWISSKAEHGPWGTTISATVGG